MDKNKKQTPAKGYTQIGTDFFVEFWEESWTYIKTVVDVLREPVLILDKEFRVLAANQAFYDLFQVELRDTEGKIIYELGSGQWDIPVLRDLLEDILPKNTFFKGFEVTHEFPAIGQRTIILNARHIYSKDKTTSELFPPIIMLAMQDVTDIMSIAETFSQHTNHLQEKLSRQAVDLEKKVAILEKKVSALSKK